jgi:hypothetical protein
MLRFPWNDAWNETGMRDDDNSRFPCLLGNPLISPTNHVEVTDAGADWAEISNQRVGAFLDPRRVGLSVCSSIEDRLIDDISCGNSSLSLFSIVRSPHQARQYNRQIQQQTFTTLDKQSLNMSKRSISDVLTANPAATNSKRSKTDESALLLTLDEPSVLALPQTELALAFFNLRTSYLEQKASLQALEKANTAAAKAVPVTVVTWSPEKIKEKRSKQRIWR